MELRDADLEHAIVKAPADPAPCLVYADWLEERGCTLPAACYRLLGGEPAESPEVERGIGVLAVAAAVWLWSWDAQPLYDDRRESRSKAHTEAVHAAFESVLYLHSPFETRAGTPPPIAAPTAAWGEVSEALAAAHQGELASAARRARACAPAEDFHHILRLAIENVAATGRGSLVADTSFAEQLKALDPSSPKVVLPEPEDTQRFRFEHIFITAATQGVDGELYRLPDGTSPLAVAAWLCEDEVAEGPMPWVPLGYFDMLQFAYGYLIFNEGEEPLVGGKPTPLLDLLGSWGTFRRGACTPQTDFPDHLFEVDGALIHSRLIY